MVDDEDTLRALLCEELEEEGAIVTEAKSGRLAFEKIQNIKIDVVVSDVRMPDGDGISLLTELRTKYPKLPIVFLVTGFSNTSAETAKKLGAIEVFDKPYEFSNIVAEILKGLRTFGLNPHSG